MDFHRLHGCFMADLRVSPALALGAGALAFSGSGGIWAAATRQSKEVRRTRGMSSVIKMETWMVS